MRVSVIICSIGRPGILDDTVQSLLHQTYPIDEILIGTPSTENVLPSSLEHPVVRLLLTKTGLTVQRNACLSSVKASSDLVVFVDDDMEFAPSYMAAMVELFEATPDLIVSSGNLLFDGGVGKSIGREEARRLCAGKQAASAHRRGGRPLTVAIWLTGQA